MRILVAGGAGYVGSVLVPMLMDRGHEVDVADSCWFGNHLPPAVRVFRRDLFEFEERDLKGYEQVIFLAGLSNDPMAEFSPAMNFVHNGALPAYLTYVAKKAGVKRFIYASSCSVYGFTENQVYDESAPVTCGYPYGISKLQGERGVMQLGDASFSTIALRQGTVSGYSPRMRFDLIVNTMFKCAMLNGEITINNPSIWRPILDVRDTSAAFIRAVHADYLVSGVFNVASGNFTVGQVGEIVKNEIEKLSGRKVNIRVQGVQDFRNYKVTCEQAQKTLGFSPKYSIADMVQNLYARLREFGDFSNEEYYNIARFKKLFGEQPLPGIIRPAHTTRKAA